ncbi:MAG: M56 family metallopeptidase [Opitutaceae bacterium]|nr:M56 family metallopeptidase [Opitutaceae bacterium]
MTALTGALWKSSLQASLVIALVVVVQWAAGKRLSPRVRYALWLLVVARLALPISLESGVSVFNYTQSVVASVARAANSVAASDRQAVTETGRTGGGGEQKTEVRRQRPEVSPGLVAEAGPAREKNVAVAGAAAPSIAAVPMAPAKSWPWPLILSLGWLAGVVFLQHARMPAAQAGSRPG